MSNPVTHDLEQAAARFAAEPGRQLALKFKAYQACLSTSIYDMSREEREADQVKVEQAFKACRGLADQILQGGGK